MGLIKGKKIVPFQVRSGKYNLEDPVYSLELGEMLPLVALLLFIYLTNWLLCIPLLEGESGVLWHSLGAVNGLWSRLPTLIRLFVQSNFSNMLSMSFGLLRPLN